MRLLDIVNRAPEPAPWGEGDNIPWHDPAFSQRMLKEHLTQEHDAASRRFEIIDQHVDWIHHQLLSGHSAKILDLGCGPGLYSSRLARLGHDCLGIDYGPASIAHAEAEARKDGLRCTYRHQDIRTAEYGSGFDLVMLIFGEFNVFRPTEAMSILQKAHRALADGGILLLEPHTFSVIERLGGRRPFWYSAQSELFSDSPHLYLEESFWDASSSVATIRYYIVDAATGKVTRYAQSLQAYTDEEYNSVLLDNGFKAISRCPSLTGKQDPTQSDLFALIGRKGATEAPSSP
ncbi:MAG: class I SAM-dependent methyltransferase [Anaerolineae bacterium]|jgi:SAM-dependent methyltransferase